MLGITRETKRLIITIIFFLILLVGGTAIYFLRKPAPTCFDQIQNQNEGGVDCGGVCALACVEHVVGDPLVVKEVTFLPAGNGVYDAVATVLNPNGDIGASNFQYVFSLKDASGTTTAQSRGSSWILPSETKSFLAFGISANSAPVSATLEITDLNWQRLSNYRGAPNVSVSQKRYNQISSGVGYAEATGTLTNGSPYDFRTLSVKVILRDPSGKPLAVNQTQMNTVRANEQRDFRLVWPTAFPGAVANVDMEVDADVYHSENFERQYFPGGKFQESLPQDAFR